MSHDVAVKRILMLHEYPGGFGGAERYLEILSGGLRRVGVAVAAVVHAADPGAANDFVERLRAAGVDVALHRGRSWPLSIARAVRRWSPDVLHWNGIDPFAFRGGTWMLLPWRRPSVLTDHLPMMRTGMHWETTRKLVNRRLPAVVVVGSEGAAAAAAHWRPPFSPRIVVVRNGVPTGAGSQRGPLPGRHAELLFLGRLEEQKDPTFVLDLLEALHDAGHDVRLTFGGAGSLAHHLRRRVDASPSLQGAVRFAGFVSDPSAILDAADVFVSPARFEGLPFTPLEALAAGLPMVLSDIPPHREISDTGAGAVVAPLGDVGAWADAVVAILADLEARSGAALGQAELFSAERMVKETLRVYAAVVAR